MLWLSGEARRCDDGERYATQRAEEKECASRKSHAVRTQKRRKPDATPKARGAQESRRAGRGSLALQRLLPEWVLNYHTSHSRVPHASGTKDAWQRAVVACPFRYPYPRITLGCKFDVNEETDVIHLEERTARLTILIDPRKKAVFERLCSQEDLTSSQVVRRMIRSYIEERLGRPWSPGEEDPDSSGSAASRNSAKRRTSRS